MLFLGLTAVTIASWTRHPRIVEAAEFLVRDRSGNVLARLGQAGSGDTCLTLRANQNVSVANLCVQNAEGASLDLHNLKSESRAMLTPGFTMSEPMVRFTAGLTVVEDGKEIGSNSPRMIKSHD
jgi:hypothetical protein